MPVNDIPAFSSTRVEAALVAKTQASRRSKGNFSKARLVSGTVGGADNGELLGAIVPKI